MFKPLPVIRLLSIPLRRFARERKTLFSGPCFLRFTHGKIRPVPNRSPGRMRRTLATLKIPERP